MKSCEVCNKSVRKDHLKTHMATHKSTPEQAIQSNNEYLCEVCGECFSQIRDLEQHRRNIHGM